MRRNPRHVTPDDMDSALVSLGFWRRAGRGDHRVYLHAELPYPVVIDPHFPHLKRYQVEAALHAIDELPED